MDLQLLRREIDRINFEILKLLDRRMEAALCSRKLKKDITDKKREDEVLAYIKKHSKGLCRPEFCNQLFLEIIKESKRLQGEDYQLVAFQGEHGAYGEVAARKYDDTLVYIPNVEFSDVVTGVEEGYFDFGILPVENSIGGAVSPVNELLVERDIMLIGEIEIPIQHCLLTLPETKLEDIRIVYSHPQALSQCATSLRENKQEARPFYDTAGAAKMISDKKPSASAAIASELCAELYHLKIAARNIEDHSLNKTRFVIVKKCPPRLDIKKLKGKKTSILFATNDRAGALYEVLALFVKQKLNLSRIESMPDRRTPGRFIFFLDFMGNVNAKNARNVLEALKKQVVHYKFLGCYDGKK